jgi:hypothetical protein
MIYELISWTSPLMNNTTKAIRDKLNGSIAQIL